MQLNALACRLSLQVWPGWNAQEGMTLKPEGHLALSRDLGIRSVHIQPRGANKTTFWGLEASTSKVSITDTPLGASPHAPLPLNTYLLSL